MFIETESRQNEQYFNMILQTSKALQLKMKQLKLIDEGSDEEHEQELEKDRSRIDKLDNQITRAQELANLSISDHEKEDDKASVNSFESGNITTRLGVYEWEEDEMRGEYLPSFKEKGDMSIVPDEALTRKVQAPNERLHKQTIKLNNENVQLTKIMDQVIYQ